MNFTDFAFYNELLWFAMLVFNFAAILLIYRFLGKLGLFIWIPIACIIANIQVLKFVELFGITATLGNIVYATSFLATDILSENYGKKDAKKAVVIGFISVVSMMILMNVAILFKPASDDFAHESIKTLFSLMPRIVLASFAAYWVSQLHDVWAYSFWKKRKPDPKFIWLRNNASTWVSQLIDSLIFTSIAFLGMVSFPVFIEILLTTYLLKVIVAAMDTPLVYWAQKWHRNGKIREVF